MGSIQTAEHYDLISLGSGEAGKFIAWTQSAAGKRCAVIERRWLGGSCPQVACLPSKNVIHSAKLFSSHGERLGQHFKETHGSEGANVDMQVVKQRKTDMVNGLNELHSDNFQKTGAEFVWGDGCFVGPKMIKVTDAEGHTRYLTGDKIVICTGSRARIGDVQGLKEAHPLTHVEMLDIAELPTHLIIIGGGYVGLEFAQAMRRFGAEVTVIEHNDRILKHEDEDVATVLTQVLEADGVVFSTSTSLSSVSGKSGQTVTLKGDRSGEPIEIKGSHILCATGRLPNNDKIGLETAGVKLTRTGQIVVDEWNRANEDGLYAVGDCSGSPYFTHIGFDDFRIVRDHLTGKADSEKRRSTRQVPFTLFTEPEFAHIGLREHEAKARGVHYRLSKLPMMAFLRTRTLGETTGFAKLLVSEEDDKILGFSVIGSGAGELLPVVQLAMKKGLPYTDIAELVITHPTLNEGLTGLFNAVPKRS